MAIRKTIVMICSMLLFFIGCQKKEVQLPLIDIPGISEIQNHSSIWVFMETKNGKIIADLNKGNKILNTHWIYNIDRRLPMKEVVPVLIAMQENKNKDSMHKKGDMNSYFSYADTKSSTISLLLFPQTNFITNDTANNVMKEFRVNTCTAIIELVTDDIKLNGKRQALTDLASNLKKGQQCTDEEKLRVMLMFDEDTSYQDYLELKVYLHANDIHCESAEYFHTVK
ncbi:hypothetical protein QWY87_05570 [Lutimonas halocynthiae]|uniref:hypothetical protein n=1 Tax=Lutimonas halocynthiae TaxID=1446477 RepID=UPI0025B289EA|nr:hypothetical protein [Lutimonas halocynthiae]MDN3642158.1 hypothetical protein [Lutimonas halocynthiae]